MIPQMSEYNITSSLLLSSTNATDYMPYGALMEKLQETMNSKSYSLHLRISPSKRAGNNPKILSFSNNCQKQTKWKTSQNLKSAWIQNLIIIPQVFWALHCFEGKGKAYMNSNRPLLNCDHWGNLVSYKLSLY